MKTRRYRDTFVLTLTLLLLLSAAIPTWAATGGGETTPLIAPVLIISMKNSYAVVTQQVNTCSKEIIGRVQGGPIQYDQIFTGA